MAIFKQMSREEREARGFNFLVLLFLIPVWIKMEYIPEEDAWSPIFGDTPAFLPPMQEANWVPRPLLWIATIVAGGYLFGSAVIFGRPHIPLVPVWTTEELY